MPSQTNLIDRHAILEEQIEAEMKRPSPDDIKLQSLKKEKLLIKEQIEH